MNPSCRCNIKELFTEECNSGHLPTATPGHDFIPIVEKLTFTKGQSQGDSVCTNITIISDTFVERQETFEVLLDTEDRFAVVIQPEKDRGTVTISDGEEYNSKAVI